jgi:hypothetical protein
MPEQVDVVMNELKRHGKISLLVEISPIAEKLFSPQVTSFAPGAARN